MPCYAARCLPTEHKYALLNPPRRRTPHRSAACLAPPATVLAALPAQSTARCARHGPGVHHNVATRANCAKKLVTLSFPPRPARRGARPRSGPGKESDGIHASPPLQPHSLPAAAARPAALSFTLLHQHRNTLKNLLSFE